MTIFIGMDDALRRQFTDRRLQLGLTQAELAERAATSRKTVSDFELGKAGLQLTTLNRLLAALGFELTLRDAGSRPTLDELRERYPDDLGAPPEGNRRVKRSRAR